jgi:protein-disulfide isomerase
MNRAALVGSAAAVVLVGLGVAGLLAHRHRESGGSHDPASAQQMPDSDLMLPARTMGDPKAPVTIYDISDFQCPYCRQFWQETLPAIEREYVQTGKARLTFINLPIPQLHRNALAAHEVAMCAAAQNRFWVMHDLLYAHQRDWAGLANPKAYFLALADSARLDSRTFTSCVNSGRMRPLVGAEREAALRNGVQSTPSFVIQGILLTGFAPITDWRPVLDSIYNAQMHRVPSH